MNIETLDEVTPKNGMRVRFVSEDPDREPQGTITDSGHGAVVVTWDDDHAPSCIERARWHHLERV